MAISVPQPYSTPFYGSTTIPAKAVDNNVYIFDIRIQTSAVTVSSGEAVSTTTGAVEYRYNDMKDNSGNVTLPYG